MTPQEKKTRLKQLQKDPYLSDEEIEEIQQLIEELAITENNEAKPREETTIAENKPTVIKEPKKQRRSLYSILKERLSEKPATIDEIRQLKLDAIRAELKARIAKAKAAKRKARGSTLGSLVAPPTREPRYSEPRRRKNHKEYDKLSSENIRKTFWG